MPLCCKFSNIYRRLQWSGLISSNGLSPLQIFREKCVLAQKLSQALQKNRNFDLIQCFGVKGSILVWKGSSLGPTVKVHVSKNLGEAITKREDSILSFKGSSVEGIFPSDSFFRAYLNFNLIRTKQLSRFLSVKLSNKRVGWTVLLHKRFLSVFNYF